MRKRRNMGEQAGEKDKDAALRLLDPMDISQVRSYFSDH